MRMIGDEGFGRPIRGSDVTYRVQVSGVTQPNESHMYEEYKRLKNDVISDVFRA